MKTLPKEVTERAFVSEDGKYGWRNPEIFAALHAIAESEQAILGGDFWRVENGERQQIFPGTKSMRAWDTKPQSSGESWQNYCQRTCNESIETFNELFLLDSVREKEARSSIFYNPTYVEYGDIENLIPRSKMDEERAEAAVKAGYPMVEPILPELLEWMQDMNWPVANVLGPFLTSIGTPLIPHIREIFKTNDEMWKYWMISVVMSESRVIAEAFREELERIAYSPTESEKLEELDDKALKVLQQYVWDGAK